MILSHHERHNIRIGNLLQQIEHSVKDFVTVLYMKIYFLKVVLHHF